MTSYSFKKSCSMLALYSAAATAFAVPVVAQDADTDKQGNALLEEILVTATKKSALQNAQDVPVAVTAFGERQLDAVQFRDLESLSFKMPNVSLDDIGTSRGVANFTIRGIGVNSSIPSIDPTVGVFVDGVYLGLISGVVFDQFDLASVEVLRGPQGLLFGRNVTGGAVLMNTIKPSFETKVRARAAYESGDNFILNGTLTGPVIEDKLALKLAVHYNNDGGYFDNLVTGTKVGKAETLIFRPAFTLRASDDVEVTVRYEHGDAEGDGPVTQNRGLYDRTTFDLGYDNIGYYDNTWDQLIGEINIDVGTGAITNITGWRKSKGLSGGDIDGTPLALFHSDALTEAEQFSNELRYNGTFENFDLTAGLFYFDQDLVYREHRFLLFGAADYTGGGDQSQSTKAAFASVDYNLSDTLTLNVGLRYTKEKKAADIATLPLNGCAIDTTPCSYDFADEESWDSWSPKIGLQWTPKDDMQVYGFFTQGYRSGGYNMRNTSPTASPGPFGQEKQNSFELGLKLDNADKTIRLNAAAFYNKLYDLQREVNLPDPTAGVVQIIRNTADARVMGFEAELIAQLHENLTFTGSIGVLDDKYTSAIYDISGDGVVDDGDTALQLPRLAPVTWGAGLRYSAPVADWGSLSAGVNFNHRDQSYYNDANTAILDAVDMLDASITLGVMDDSVKFTVFGKNLLNEVYAGGETLLPFGPGHTLSPLKKGRVFGVEAKYSF
ncbi:TonB-dependent receptor [Kordiimonas pumila]|uniref:TonB-dependent receptor n=1 Tax=Kordiimonas pumila TaxID=2161677 RepID=A0ABV7D3P6_9PROT|nr:TonB-dependent receptor [Kordiimonas pumila]